MKNRRRRPIPLNCVVIAAWSTLLAACAGVTDVVATGPDTFMVASHGVMGWSSGPAQKAKAYQEAGDYCAKRGLQMVPVGAGQTSDSGFGKIASAEVQFRCVKPEDVQSHGTAN